MVNGSKIYQQNRALGYVSNHVPATVRYLFGRKENLVTTCVGKSFQTYGTNHFRLLAVSGLHTDDINCLASDRFLIYSGSGKNIYGWRAGSEIKHKYIGHEGNVLFLVPFGKHLISVDDNSKLIVWDKRSETVHLELPFEKNDFKISAILHPNTYINKIVIGSEQGGLQLWNIRTGRMIHEFSGFEKRINVIEQAPVIDIVAVGLSDGKIILLNLLTDVVLMEFKQEWGPVTGIAFRTDGKPIMATSCTNGQIAFWDLEEKKVISTLHAHTGSINTLRYLPNEPLLLTTSDDNSLKLWVFDKMDDGPRLLRYRDGHAAPPLSIRYHGANGESILSAGEDSTMRIFSTISETLNVSMGRASFAGKKDKKTKLEEDPALMPPIIQFTSETTREKEWDSIAAIHSDLVMTTTWSFDKRRMGTHRLTPPKYDSKNKIKTKAVATSIALSHCGNFVLIGYSAGDVERFNIQSGLHRATYGKPKAHETEVRGIVTDNLNQIVITGGSDCYIKFWNFKNEVATSIGTIKMPDSILLFRGHRESSMLCAALEDFSVYIVDYDTKNIVRKFIGHTAAITDACFSPDSRWLITSSMDCTIKTWDIPSSYLIDQFKMTQPCISLSMSPTGDYLATAHVDFLGVYLWANKTLYEHVSLRALDPNTEAPAMELPNMINYENPELDGLMEAVNLVDDEETEEGEFIKFDYKTPSQLDDGLITMSTLAESRWKNLLNLDLIKKRNKPKEPLKKPKQAPFFLPTVAGLDLKFDLNGEAIENDENSNLKKQPFLNLTTFGNILKSCGKSVEFINAINHIINLNPSMIDYEIKSLSTLGGGSVELMHEFLQMITEMFTSNQYFELAQSYLALFLKAHEEELVAQKKLYNYLGTVEAAQNNGWRRIEADLLYGVGVVSNLRTYC